MKTEWTEDADLGVAVREVGRARYMQIRPLTPEGRMRIYNALATLPNSLWQYGRERRDLRLRDNIIEIDPAHRLAFARALYPLTSCGCTSLASAIVHQECSGMAVSQ
jgi:hypothetical protein